MKQYLDLLQDILDHGSVRKDRTGTGTISVFGRQMRFENVGDRFPLVTTKKMGIKNIAKELLWFVSGSTNAKDIEDQGCNIWKEWGDPDTREMGPIYGAQWRRWRAIELKDKARRPNVHRKVSSREDCEHLALAEYDQLAEAVRLIKEDPYSRRIIVNCWHVDQIDDMALPPCHTMFQFYVRECGVEKVLDLQLYQRSCDMFLGCPYNIASYAILLMMVAQVTGCKAGDFIHTIGDAHIYLNHVEQIKEQLTRVPFLSPVMRLNEGVTSIDGFKIDDFVLDGYQCHPAIKGEVSV